MALPSSPVAAVGSAYRGRVVGGGDAARCSPAAAWRAAPTDPVPLFRSLTAMGDELDTDSVSFDEAAIEAPGADEVAVLPWPALFRHRMARRVESSDRYEWWVLWTVLAGLFSVSFTITILAVSLPRIAADLHSDTTTLTWVITGPLLAFGVVGPLLGKAGDIWGQKRMFMLALSLTLVFAGLTAAAWNASSLILFRVLGAGEGAATGPASMAMIMMVFRPEDRVKAMGFWSLIAAGAPVFGVVAGGPIVEHVSWRLIYIAQIPFTRSEEHTSELQS